VDDRDGRASVVGSIAKKETSRRWCRARAPYFATRVGRAPARPNVRGPSPGEVVTFSLQRPRILATFLAALVKPDPGSRSGDEPVRYTRRTLPSSLPQAPSQFVYRHSGGLIGFGDTAADLAPDDHRAQKRRTRDHTALTYLRMANRLVVWPPTEGVIPVILACRIFQAHPVVKVQSGRNRFLSARLVALSLRTEKQTAWPTLSIRHNMGLAPIMHLRGGVDTTSISGTAHQESSRAARTKIRDSRRRRCSFLGTTD